MEKVSLSDKLSLINEYWSPKIVGALNGQHVKLAKVKGEFVMHHHADEDELFLVLSGSLTIKFKESSVTLSPGEFLIVPKGVDHQPIANEETHLLLFEPASTLNTGQLKNTLTIESPEHL